MENMRQPIAVFEPSAIGTLSRQSIPGSLVSGGEKVDT